MRVSLSTLEGRPPPPTSQPQMSPTLNWVPWGADLRELMSSPCLVAQTVPAHRSDDPSCIRIPKPCRKTEVTESDPSSQNEVPKFSQHEQFIVYLFRERQTQGQTTQIEKRFVSPSNSDESHGLPDE